MQNKKEKCRSPSKEKNKKQEQLSEQDIRSLMAHTSYERSGSGAIRSKRRLVVLK